MADIKTSTSDAPAPHSPSDPNRWRFPEHYRLVPKKHLDARIKSTARMLADRGLAGGLFTLATDVYYLCGSMQQGAVFVGADGQPLVFMRRHFERARAESPLEVTEASGFSQMAKALIPRLGAGARLGACFDVMTTAEYLGWQKRLPKVELVDIAQPFLAIKGVKDEYEIEAMAEAGRRAAEGFAQIPGLLKPGMREDQFSAQLMAVFMAKGHIDVMRTRRTYIENYGWQIVSGPEGNRPSALDAAFVGFGPSPAFPQGAGPRRISPGDPVVVDLGFCWDGYHTDQARTYVIGQASEMVRRAHECLAAVQDAILEMLRPGAVSGEIYDRAKAVASELGFGDHFLGRADQRIVFVGHGLGLELGAPPYLMRGSKETVRANQAYALELKLVLDEGPVGLENTYVVTESGAPRWLSQIPNQLYQLPS